MKISTCIAGTFVPNNMVEDVVFAKELLGKTACIAPVDGKVIAPFDASVEVLFPTLHAIGLKHGELELLIHIGINTVELEGKHFTSHIKQGQQVKAGDVLVEFDVEAIRNAAYNPVTMMIVTNSKAFDLVKAEYEAGSIVEQVFIVGQTYGN
ncbi:MAG: PTS sugar transporter subunit IIA [Erysipelotrichaceae bacterium]